MTLSQVDITSVNGSKADGHVLAVYLSLPEPRLVLDLRVDNVFHQAHLVNSYHIYPISEIKSRYSYLPPRDVPFLVLGNFTHHPEILKAFASTPSAKVVLLSQPTVVVDEMPIVANSLSVHFTACKDFLAAAHSLGLVRSSHSHEKRITQSSDDVPRLLFRPSNAVRRTVLQLEGELTTKRSLRVLDLGCGAARDLAWILHGSRARSEACTWTGIGVDNWKAALNRAQQLMDDLYLSARGASDSQTTISHPQCEKLLWAKCSDDGYLEPLVGSGKGKSIRTSDISTDDALSEPLWRQCEDLGLGPVLPAPGSFTGPKFDLILCVRFHPRPLLPRLSRLVRIGGLILLSHFVTVSDEEREASVQAHPTATIDYDSPPHEGRIQPGEIEGLVETYNQSVEAGCKWILAESTLEPIEDGRIIKSVVLRKMVL